MHTLKFSALLAVSSFAALAGATPPQDDTSIQVQGVPLGRYNLSVDEFRDFRGKYALADGKILTLSNEHKHYFAQLDQQPRVEIVPVAHNVFVARGADLSLSFEDFRDGQLNDVVFESRHAGLARALQAEHRAHLAYGRAPRVQQ